MKMDIRKKVILIFLAIFLFLIAVKLSIDFPTGLGVYYGNTSATNPEGTIRFTVAQMIAVTLISPPDNTIFTIPGNTLNVSLTCTVSNLTPANVTQVKLYTDIFGPFGVTQVVNVSGAPPHTVTFNVSNVPLGTYNWNCEGITSTGISAFAPSNWRFTIRKTPTPPTPGGGGGTGWIPPPVVELAEYPLPCVMPPENLTSWWTFDADLDDFWNESNEGLPAGQPRYVKRTDDLAIVLDGKEDYLMISPDNTYDSHVEGTIDGWINYKNKQDYAVIFSYSDTSRKDSLAKHLQLRINPGGDIELEYRDGKNYRIIQPDATFDFKKNAKKWVHFAVTYENGEYAWYLNGVQYGSKTVVEEGMPLYWFNDLSDSDVLTGDIGAGIEGGLPVDYFYGAIDEIEIYDRALTFYEINAIYARSKCKVKPPKMPVKEHPEIPLVEEAEKILKETKLYQPELITPIPWWLLILALLGIAAVLLAYYKGIKKKHVSRKAAKKSRKKSRRKKRKRKK
ncbi:hypothetical protein KY338_03655 [Candidatus Woesearchaeota archaeon]|nr:hypothetical protein [Candidatus Woesearchaeota archaeon]MBW3005300.1 hypothetical protein [Candidatus Woesearchaeota archaeon]